MGFKCGLIGLPNVGKSTLFNAMTSDKMAEAANYPFCTIEPNIGNVAVPDERLNILANLCGSQKIIPSMLSIVDIAGLVAGASKGEGLGNKFLGHIREVDAIIHVLRCFEDDNITHVAGSVDPIRDAEIIETELILSDIEFLQKKILTTEKKAKSGDKIAKIQLSLAQQLLETLNKGIGAASFKAENSLSEDELHEFTMMNLLSAKPILYVCNLSEKEILTGNENSDEVKSLKQHVLFISAQVESEIASISDPEEREMFLGEIGLKTSGLNQIIRAGYELLDLSTFFTVGPKEAHAWTIPKICKAPQAAGKIHTDFEKGFIRAEIISYHDFITHQSEAAVKEAGKMRLEGKDYFVQDGDVVHFRFNV